MTDKLNHSPGNIDQESQSDEQIQAETLLTFLQSDEIAVVREAINLRLTCAIPFHVSEAVKTKGYKDAVIQAFTNFLADELLAEAKLIIQFFASSGDNGETIHIDIPNEIDDFPELVEGGYKNAMEQGNRGTGRKILETYKDCNGVDIHKIVSELFIQWLDDGDTENAYIAKAHAEDLEYPYFAIDQNVIVVFYGGADIIDLERTMFNIVAGVENPHERVIDGLSTPSDPENLANLILMAQG